MNHLFVATLIRNEISLENTATLSFFVLRNLVLQGIWDFFFFSGQQKIN